MRYILLLLVSLSLPVYAGGRHRPPEPIPEPPPADISDDGSNHNAFAIAVFIAAGVCIYYKCWKPKPVKAETSLVPEIPKNEYTYTIKP